MLCKKCNTAIPDNDYSCNYCGAKTGNRRNGILAVCALILSAGIIFGTYAYYSSQAQDIFILEETSPPSDVTSPPPTRAPAENEEQVPSFTPDYTKTMDEIRHLVDSVAKAAMNFYNEFSSFGTYVTKYGYFFEYSSNNFIKTEDLVITDLDPNYAGESVLILYLRPSDLSGYRQLNVKPSDKLEIFAAYETKEGFVIASVNNPGGILPREELHKVLEKYNYVHGEPRVVPYGGADYQQIMEALAKQAGVEANPDIRYLRQDDKYAVAIVSPRDDSTDVNQFVLEKTSGKWNVVIYNYENYDMHKAVINARLVDINLELIPHDDLTVLRKYFRRSYTDVIGTMKMNAFILDEDGAAVYQAGTNNFCYLVFESGKRFLGHLNNDAWVLYKIDSYEQAVEIMYSLQKWPPLVILKQY